MLHGWEQLANKFDRGIYITTKGTFQRMPTIAEKSFVSITRAMCDKWKIYDKHIKQHSLPPFFKDWAIKPQHDVFVSLVYILNFPYWC